MNFSDATTFFTPQKKQDEVSSSWQQPPLHVSHQSYSSPPNEGSKNEMQLSSFTSVPSLDEETPSEKRDQVRAVMGESTRVGHQFGNYRLIRFLGQGGFAEVYLGEHLHLGSWAAIKVLQSQLAKEDIDTFRAEARTLVRLIHPHIVRILDFGIEDKIPFLVMDYAPNGTLRQLHPKGQPVPLATVISYVKQVAEALQFAHNEKIIHRDIKPENMLVGTHYNILLSDFGIATIVQSLRYQSVRDMAGTVAYMAPEQIQAHPRFASDQYSLGVVVYEWLCGARPFHGSIQELAIKNMVVPPPSLCERVPGLPATVEEVVFRALAKDPKDRFESVKAFALALEQAR